MSADTDDSEDKKGGSSSSTTTSGIVAAIAARLTIEGYECLPAGSARTTRLSLYERGGVDLVITDLNMPACDGIALSERLREIRAASRSSRSPPTRPSTRAARRTSATRASSRSPFEWDALLALVAD
jgi:CheY-like chemotaxis protein